MLAAALGTLIPTALATPTAHPVNPLLTVSGVVVADDGVSYFDSRTRSLRWQSLMHLQTDAPTLAGERLFVGTSRGLYALELSRGRVVWHFPSENRLFSPVVAGGSVYSSGEDGSLRSLSAVNGEVLWRQRFSGWIYAPAVAGGRLFVAGQAHRLMALSIADGSLVWEQALPHEPVYRPVLVGRELVVITTFAADVLALDARTGAPRWSVRDSIANFSPQVHGERLYFRTMDGGIRVRRAEDGVLQWAATLDGRSEHPLVFQGGQVMALDGEARLRIFAIDSGMPVTDRRSLADGDKQIGRFGDHTVILGAVGAVMSQNRRPAAQLTAAP